jgi:hypothetical protein
MWIHAWMTGNGGIPYGHTLLELRDDLDDETITDCVDDMLDVCCQPSGCRGSRWEKTDLSTVSVNLLKDKLFDLEHVIAKAESAKKTKKLIEAALLKKT